MTSTASPIRPRSAPSWGRSLLLVTVLALLAAQTPGSWGTLWLAVPAAVAASMLAGWRFGVRGVFVPIALFGAAMAVSAPPDMWAWWVPAASLSGLWMGLREEGEGPTLGDRSWMLLPVLLLAAALPWAIPYGALVERTARQLQEGDRQLLDWARQLGYATDRIRVLDEALAEQARLRARMLPHVLPTAVFLWMAVLVMAGRSLGSRVAASFRWPPVSRAPLARWRMPDGALWLLFAGLALLVSRASLWAGTGWTLLLNAALGFGVQGIAVVESLLLARGIPLSVVVMTLLFVSTFAMPVFVLAVVAVGLSDVWLDYRRLEPATHAEDA